MPSENRLAVSLLALRAGVFVVMLMWTLDLGSDNVTPAHDA